MKKKLCLFLILSVAAVTGGCGQKKDTGVISISPIEEAKGDVQGEEKTKDALDVLGGVYPGGDELISIPMGESPDEEQENLVNIDMPLNYMFTAFYIEDQEGKKFENAEGDGSLATALQFKFQEEPHEVSDVILKSPQEDGTIICYSVFEDTLFSQYKDSVETEENYSAVAEIDSGRAIYFSDEREAAKNELFIAYKISDTAFVRVSYSGPLNKEQGRKQLAEDICSLINVIE